MCEKLCIVEDIQFDADFASVPIDSETRQRYQAFFVQATPEQVASWNNDSMTEEEMRALTAFIPRSDFDDIYIPLGELIEMGFCPSGYLTIIDND